MLKYRKLYDRLMQEKIQIVEKLEQLRVLRQPQVDGRENSSFGKREEEATESLELEKRLAIEDQIKGLITSVEHALKKFEDGTYCLCDSTHLVFSCLRL